MNRKRGGVIRTLTDAEKQAIIQLSEVEKYQTDIARKVGVSPSVVCKVLKGEQTKERGMWDFEGYVRELVTI